MCRRRIRAARRCSSRSTTSNATWNTCPPPSNTVGPLCNPHSSELSPSFPSPPLLLPFPLPNFFVLSSARTSSYSLSLSLSTCVFLVTVAARVGLSRTRYYPLPLFVPVPLRWTSVHVLCVFMCCLWMSLSAPRGARRPSGARGLAARPGAAGGDAPHATADGAQSARGARRLAHVDHVGRVPVRRLARRAHTHRFTFPLVPRAPFPCSRMVCSSQVASSQ